MTTLAAVGRRVLPRGWGDLAKQLAIWFGFLFAYQAARGIADRNPPKAFDNGLKVIGFERHMHGLIELSFQRFVDSSQFLMNLASWTYWNSEFTVVALALLWVYLRRHEAFIRFRNAILLANVIGLVGYVLLPTAPPRMFPEAGFTDTLAAHSTVNHSSTFVAFASNPYAAMPSLHALDATIVSVVMATVVRRRWAKALWLCWAPWVWFAVMATGNHFWLDVAAGVLVAGIAAAIVYRPWRRLRARPAAA